MNENTLSTRDDAFIPDSIQSFERNALQRRQAGSSFPQQAWSTELLASIKDARLNQKRTESSIDESMANTRKLYDERITYLKREIKRLNPSDERKAALSEQLAKILQEYRDSEQSYRNTKLELLKESNQLPWKCIGYAVIHFVVACVINHNYQHNKQQ